MVKLIIAEQTGATRPKVVTFPNGSTIDGIIAKQFGILPPSEARLFLNGDEVYPTEFKTITKKLKKGDEVKVIREVKGFVGEALSFATLGLSDVIFDAVRDLITPDIPQLDTGTSGSPNNSYTSQTNIIRAFAQKALVCGSPKIYPDLIGEPLEYYQDNIKQSEQYFYVCFGTLNGGTIQAGNTNINKFSATTTRYEPVAGVTTIPNYRIGQSVDEVDGQTIRGTNEGTIGQIYDVSQGPTSNTYLGTTFVIYVTQNTISDQLKTDFDAGIGNVEVSYDYTFEDGEGLPETATATGTGSISEMVLIGSEYKITIPDFNGIKSFNGTYTVNDISTIISSGIGPFSNPIECEKMFFNIIFRQGLKATVDLEIKVYELESKGGARVSPEVVETFNVSYTEDSPNDQINRTLEITISNGRSWYEFEIYRTNEESQDTSKPDVPTLENVYCVQERGNTDFNNATMLKNIMRSTQLPTSGGVDNKINIINGQVEMPRYDINTGNILANAPSRNFADAVLFLVKDFYGYSDAQCKALLDLDSLYTIANSLTDDFKTFDYTFDDVKQSFEDRLGIICNVARVAFYKEANKIVFWRNEAVTNPSTALTRRDIINPEMRQYSISRSLFVSNGKDSIQLEYIDRATNKPKFIYRSINGAGSIVNTPGANPKKVTLTGCQNEINATNRADLEIRQMLYQHTQGSDTFMKSQILLNKGDVVLWDEIYETQGITTGQFTSINGLVAQTSNGIDATKTYNMYYNNADGYLVGPQSITVNSKYEIAATDLTEAYPPIDDSPLGSPYFLVETTATPTLWRVVDKAVSSDSVQLTMAIYDARIYEND